MEIACARVWKVGTNSCPTFSRTDIRATIPGTAEDGVALGVRTGGRSSAFPDVHAVSGPIAAAAATTARTGRGMVLSMMSTRR
ncbi:hypothetical protein GCM10009780_23690 [Actinomadura alba]